VHFPAEPAGAVASLYERALLGAGDVVPGPAIIEQPDSTIVVHPGWRATVRESADIRLEREAA
jgi:N-methylhydantoinase A